jgi:hypothetical protein
MAVLIAGAVSAQPNVVTPQAHNYRVATFLCDNRYCSSAYTKSALPAQTATYWRPFIE